MPMTINGSGTITGLTPGGLPDASVLTADIADNAITPAKTQSGLLPSMIRVNTANGNGSTNPGIRRFTNIVTNQGSDITYADSATLGGTFTINTNGVYSMSFSDQFSTAGNVGISLNSTQLAISILSITAADRLGVSDTPTGNANASFSTTVYLAAGSIIRAHTNGVANGSAPSNTQFTITRVA